MLQLLSVGTNKNHPFSPGLCGCSKSVRFGTMSKQDIVKASELHVYESSLYTMPERRPAAYGVVDTRLVLSYYPMCCFQDVQDVVHNYGVKHPADQTSLLSSCVKVSHTEFL